MVRAYLLNGKPLNTFYSMTSLIDATEKLMKRGERGIDLHGDIPVNNSDGTIAIFEFSGEWSLSDVLNLRNAHNV